MLPQALLHSYGSVIRPMQAVGVPTQLERRLSARVWLKNVERMRTVCLIDRRRVLLA